MAPGIDFNNWMFNNTDRFHITIPVYIVAGESDITVSANEHARFFAKQIPTSTLVILPGKVTHWVFMNESTQEGKKLSPSITIDDPSINRLAIHRYVGEMALDFFKKNLVN